MGKVWNRRLVMLCLKKRLLDSLVGKMTSVQVHMHAQSLLLRFYGVILRHHIKPGLHSGVVSVILILKLAF